MFSTIIKNEKERRILASLIMLVGTTKRFCILSLLDSLGFVLHNKINKESLSNYSSKFEENRKTLLEYGFIKGKQALDAVESFISEISRLDRNKVMAMESELLKLLKPAYVLDGELSQYMAKKELEERNYQSLKDFIQQEGEKTQSAIFGKIENSLGSLKETINKKPEEKKPGEPTLELGFKEGIPYVNVNGEELIGLQERLFVPLVFLAVTKEVADGVVKKERDLNWAEGDQTLTQLKRVLKQSPHLKHLTNEQIIKKAGSKKICLAIFKKGKIHIDKSICKFESRHLEPLSKKIKVFPSNTANEEFKSIINQRVEQIKRECSIIKNHYSVLLKALKLKKWNLDENLLDHKNYLIGQADKIVDKYFQKLENEELNDDTI